jgi:hypothetical protein
LTLAIELTGSAPTPIDASIAGLTHSWTLKTSYYTAELSIWIDDIISTSTWLTEFSKPEAKEVIEAVGAWVYVFRHPITNDDLAKIKETIEAIKKVIDDVTGGYGESTCLAVATKQSTTTNLKLDSNDEWDDFISSTGFEYIHSEATGRNEYGEPVGIERLREALETTDWEGDAADLDFGDDDFEDEDAFGDELGLDGLAGEEAEMNMELLGMKNALFARDGDEGDEQAQVDEMGRMMGRLMAIKDTTAGMPEEERKRFAARAMRDFMKDV